MLTGQVATAEAKCADCAIRHRGVCGQVSDATRARLAQIGTLHSFVEDRNVWDGDRDRDRDHGLAALLVSGCLRMQHHDIDGRRQISCLLLPGDIVSPPAGQAGTGQIAASTAAQICRFDRMRFQRLLESTPELGRAVYALRVVKLEQLRLMTWSLGVLSVDERVCAFLALATTFLPYTAMPDGGGLLSVEMPRADVADLLNTSVESISRITRRLDAAGVIRILAPNRFEIPDLNRLVAMGCMQDILGAPALAAPTPGYAARLASPDAVRGLRATGTKSPEGIGPPGGVAAGTDAAHGRRALQKLRHSRFATPDGGTGRITDDAA